jgi:hypothetical protein
MHMSWPMELIGIREVWSKGRTAEDDLIHWAGRNTDRDVVGGMGWRHGGCLQKMDLLVVLVARGFEDNYGR